MQTGQLNQDRMLIEMGKMLVTIEWLKYLNQNDISISDKIMANLILLKYQIFKKENDNVTKQTEYLTELFEQNKSETNLRGLQAAFNATKFQIELSK